MSTTTLDNHRRIVVARNRFLLELPDLFQNAVELQMNAFLERQNGSLPARLALVFIRTDVHNSTERALATREVLTEAMDTIRQNPQYQHGFIITLARTLVRFSGSFGPVTTLARSIDHQLGQLQANNNSNGFNWDSLSLSTLTENGLSAINMVLSYYEDSIPSDALIAFQEKEDQELQEEIKETQAEIENQIEEERKKIEVRIRKPGATMTNIAKWVSENSGTIITTIASAGSLSVLVPLIIQNWPSIIQYLPRLYPYATRFANFLRNIPANIPIRGPSDFFTERPNQPTTRPSGEDVLPWLPLLGRWVSEYYYNNTPGLDPRALPVWLRAFGQRNFFK